MDSWMFLTMDGNELSSGYQGTEDQARAVAQRKANDIGAPVEFCRGTEDGEVVEPE